METGTGNAPVPPNNTGKKYRYSCKLCRKRGEEVPFDDRKQLLVHYAVTHPEHVPYNKPGGSKVVTAPASALDRMLDARNAMLSAIKDMEAERDAMHARILEMDNTIAKYRKLI